MESVELKTVHFYVLQDTIVINYFIIFIIMTKKKTYIHIILYVMCAVNV